VVFGVKNITYNHHQNCEWCGSKGTSLRL